MSILAPQTKKWLSNAVLLSFLLLVGATAFLSNAFKTPAKSHNEFIEQALVFNNKEIDLVTHLTLKNKSGEYIFERNDTTPEAQWHMTAPRDIKTSSLFVEKLFASLKTIKTKKLLLDDQVNNSNFSLEKPTAILTLADNAGKSILLSVGIMNTIDNSTYLKITGRSGIYHVEAPSVSLENITITDLVKSNVFDFDIKKILSFKIFKKNSPTPIFDVVKKDGIWQTSDSRTLDPSRLEDMIDDFVNLKSDYIIDEQNESQKKLTQSLLASGDFTVQVEKEDNEVLSYKIGSTTKVFPDVPLNDEVHFIIVENHAPIVYMVKKEFLTLFDLKNENLKSLEK